MIGKRNINSYYGDFNYNDILQSFEISINRDNYSYNELSKNIKNLIGKNGSIPNKECKIK